MWTVSNIPCDGGFYICDERDEIIAELYDETHARSLVEMANRFDTVLKERDELLAKLRIMVEGHERFIQVSKLAEAEATQARELINRLEGN